MGGAAAYVDGGGGEAQAVAGEREHRHRVLVRSERAHQRAAHRLQRLRTGDGGHDGRGRGGAHQPIHVLQQTEIHSTYIHNFIKSEIISSGNLMN